MEKKKSLSKKFNDLSKAEKVQVVIALGFSIFLVLAIPAFAWFAFSSRVETLTKIKAPSTLDIKSGHAYSIEYLDLSDVDVTELDGGGTTGHKDYIFAVKAGNNISAYDIQIAHTTNIPFTYTLYRANELGNSDELASIPVGNVTSFEYQPEGASTKTIYYYGYASATATKEQENKDVDNASAAELTLTSLNPDTEDQTYYGRLLAKKNDSKNIYSNYTKYNSNDKPEIYAVPLYSQRKNISTWDAEADYFILRLSWDTSAGGNFAEWNAATNNKETDMIYISAKASASQ